MISTRNTTRKLNVTSSRTSESCIVFNNFIPERSINAFLLLRDSEIEFASNQEAALSAGTTWSRITDLLELQNSQSKSIARAGPGTTDLTRFKEVLLRLKREGENAPGAGGY